MTAGGTDLYSGVPDLPSLVARAVALARDMRFPFSCRPEQGRLLAALASGRPGGVIGETGTGCGVGLAWMAGAASPDTRLISIELDPQRASAAQQLFDDVPGVSVSRATA